MERQPRPDIDSVLRQRNLTDIERAVMAGELPFADLQKTIAVNKQLGESELPKPEIKVVQPKTSEFILPDGQSIELPTRLKRTLELVFLADQEDRIISNEEIHLLSPFISISSAKGNFSRNISNLRKQLEEKGWEIEKGKNGIWKPFKIEKPDPKTSLVELTEPEIKTPTKTKDVEGSSFNESTFVLPDGQSANSTKIEVESGTLEPYYPTDEEISNIKGELRDFLTVIINAQRNKTRFSPEVVQKMFNDVPYSKARQKFGDLTTRLRPKMEDKGLQLISVKHEGKRRDGEWRIQKPKTAVVDNKDKAVPKETLKIKTLRLRAVKQILESIADPDTGLKSLTKSPVEFLWKIRYGEEKPVPAMQQKQVDGFRTLIMDYMQRTIIKIGDTKEEDIKKLSRKEQEILRNLRFILSKGKDDIGLIKIIEEMMKSIEKHFSPDPTSSPEPESQGGKDPSSAPPIRRRSKYA